MASASTMPTKPTVVAPIPPQLLEEPDRPSRPSSPSPRSTSVGQRSSCHAWAAIGAIFPREHKGAGEVDQLAFGFGEREIHDSPALNEKMLTGRYIFSRTVAHERGGTEH